MNKIIALFCLIPFFVDCANHNASAYPSSEGNYSKAELKAICGQPNSAPVTVNGSLCGDSQYINQPCTQVTLCSESGDYCQTIDNILLDTGSSGLRVFKSVLETNQLNFKSILTEEGNQLAGCMQFGDGGSQWGPIMQAQVQLGNLNPVQVPIMLIDAKYAIEPTNCPVTGIPSDDTPIHAGFNGILGVGLFQYDCGEACTYNPYLDRYFSCNSEGICSGTRVPLNMQVQNPVSMLPEGQNNGLIVELPSANESGSSSVTGCVYFGIDQIPENTTQYYADKRGYISTYFNRNTLDKSFLDTGSNGLYFHDESLEICNGEYEGYYCPAENTFKTARIGSGAAFSFQIANATKLQNSSYKVFSNIGAHIEDFRHYFNWGLPFFLGKKVYIGTSEEKPYWAF